MENPNFQLPYTIPEISQPMVFDSVQYQKYMSSQVPHQVPLQHALHSFESLHSVAANSHAFANGSFMVPVGMPLQSPQIGIFDSLGFDSMAADKDINALSEPALSSSGSSFSSVSSSANSFLPQAGGPQQSQVNRVYSQQPAQQNVDYYNHHSISTSSSPVYPTFFNAADPISPTTTECGYSQPSYGSAGFMEFPDALGMNELYSSPSMPVSGSSHGEFPDAADGQTSQKPPLIALNATPNGFRKLIKNSKLIKKRETDIIGKKRSSSSPDIGLSRFGPGSNMLLKKKPQNRTGQPGPIPATQPQLTLDPESGRELLTFSYSKNKIISQWTVRCPKASEKDQIMSQLSKSFLKENCIYKRALEENQTPEPQRGSRQNYEKFCNELGWQLCFLNPDLRNSRGLLQRAVDSWRNTRADEKLRSRRVRKQNKLLTKPAI